MGARLPQQQGPHLQELSDQGGQGQHQLHRGGPGQVHEDFQAEEACDAEVVFHQGQGSGRNSAMGRGYHRQGHPDDWAPALFTGSVTHRLLLIPNGKQGTGRPLTRTETFKNSWEGEMRTTAKEDFAAAFRQWYELCKIVCTSPTTMSKKVKK